MTDFRVAFHHATIDPFVNYQNLTLGGNIGVAAGKVDIRIAGRHATPVFLGEVCMPALRKAVWVSQQNH